MKKVFSQRWLMVALLALCVTCVFAEPEKKETTVSLDTVAVPQEIMQFQNEAQVAAYKVKLQHELELQKQADETELKKQKLEKAKEASQRLYYKGDETFSLFRKYFLLLLYNLIFPGVLIWLYVRHSNRKNQYREQLLDMARSGVPVQPEILDLLKNYLGKEQTTLTSISGKKYKATDMTYCMNRILWSVAILAIGVIMSMITNEEFFFVCSIAVAVVLTLQALFRYYQVNHTVNNIADNKPTDVA